MQVDSHKPLLKVCGITRQEDATVCAQMGVDFCGFVFHSASLRYVTPEHVSTLQTHGCKRVGVFTTQEPNEIVKIMELARLDYAQLHARQNDAVVRAIGGERVIRVQFPETQDVSVLAFANNANVPHVAYTLFDSGYGTGKVFDWTLLLQVPRPFFVAGGLNAKNISELLSVCHPDGVDVNSGVELSPGIKSAKMIREVKELL
ncbi:MAG: phosphoribosylanthranilate isomerase [bacterium]